jgi:hypothetical protein
VRKTASDRPGVHTGSPVLEADLSGEARSVHVLEADPSGEW